MPNPRQVKTEAAVRQNRVDIMTRYADARLTAKTHDPSELYSSERRERYAKALGILAAIQEVEQAHSKLKQLTGVGSLPLALARNLAAWNTEYDPVIYAANRTEISQSRGTPLGLPAEQVDELEVCVGAGIDLFKTPRIR